MQITGKLIQWVGPQVVHDLWPVWFSVEQKLYQEIKDTEGTLQGMIQWQLDLLQVQALRVMIQELHEAMQRWGQERRLRMRPHKDPTEC